MSGSRTARPAARGLRRAGALLEGGRVPSLDHEAPLLVLREAPGLVPTLLCEALGLALPSVTPSSAMR